MGEALVGALDRMRGADDLTTVLGIVRSTARRIVAADGATVVLREDGNCFYADEDAMSPLWKGQRFPLTECISGWAMLHDTVAVVPDITKDARIPVDAYRPTFVKSLVMVPVSSVPAVAAIGAYWAHVHAATKREVSSLTQLAAATADALARIGLDAAPFTPRAMTDVLQP